MDGTISAAAPIINSLGNNLSASIGPGIGRGGDIGTGFHSSQPVSHLAVTTQNQHTENAESKTRLDDSSSSADVSPFLPTYQQWSESPFTRYVSKNASLGTLPGGITTFKPVDRTKTGIPLNPFWIRNDTWGMAHEADIFTDPTTYFVEPRVMSKGAQSPQNHYRSVYLDNEEQPQKGSGKTGLGKGSNVVPLESGAGSVTGVAEGAPMGEMPIDAANPAKTEAPEGSEEGSKLEGGDEGKPAPSPEKKDLDGANDSARNEKSAPPKKKAKVSRIKPQTGTASKDPKKVKTGE